MFLNISANREYQALLRYLENKTKLSPAITPFFTLEISSQSCESARVRWHNSPVVCYI